MLGIQALGIQAGNLKQHILRSAFVAGHLWGKADEPNPILPDVTEWGWCYSDNKDLIPVWTFQHDDTVYKACKKKCNCGEKNNCLKGNCSCTGTKCLPKTMVAEKTMISKLPTSLLIAIV